MNAQDDSLDYCDCFQAMTFDTWSYNFLFVTQQRIILDIDEHIVFDSDGEQRGEGGPVITTALVVSNLWFIYHLFGLPLCYFMIFTL